MNAAAQLRRQAAGSDPLARRVAREQLARLQQPGRAHPDNAPPPSRWAHVPLAELFEATGNTVRPHGRGRLDCGHEPLHGSKSGRCVIIDPSAGRWWCLSCRRSGDAASFLMALHGWPYRRAAPWLSARYGPPADARDLGVRVEVTP
ncbi:MAG TPA: hypothetical protein VKV26_16260 [Dehalococcoidia bacterium]|nr:hypothetical protein [Dehalococcoidia bacterium]